MNRLVRLTNTHKLWIKQEGDAQTPKCQQKRSVTCQMQGWTRVGVMGWESTSWRRWKKVSAGEGWKGGGRRREQKLTRIRVSERSRTDGVRSRIEYDGWMDGELVTGILMNSWIDQPVTRLEDMAARVNRWIETIDEWMNWWMQQQTDEGWIMERMDGCLSRLMLMHGPQMNWQTGRLIDNYMDSLMEWWMKNRW